MESCSSNHREMFDTVLSKSGAGTWIWMLVGIARTLSEWLVEVVWWWWRPCWVDSATFKPLSITVRAKAAENDRSEDTDTTMVKFVGLGDSYYRLSNGSQLELKTKSRTAWIIRAPSIQMGIYICEIAKFFCFSWTNKWWSTTTSIIGRSTLLAAGWLGRPTKWASM